MHDDNGSMKSNNIPRKYNVFSKEYKGSFKNDEITGTGVMKYENKD
jgi:hypothetical protein